jgi:hypothetical protein
MLRLILVGKHNDAEIYKQTARMESLPPLVRIFLGHHTLSDRLVYTPLVPNLGTRFKRGPRSNLLHPYLLSAARIASCIPQLSR